MPRIPSFSIHFFMHRALRASRRTLENALNDTRTGRKTGLHLSKIHLEKHTTFWYCIDAADCLKTAWGSFT